MLLGLGKGCCVACGVLRASNGNFCSRCRTSIGTRPPISGDLVRAPKIERESNFVEVSQDAPGIWTPLLPDGLIERLRLISSNTLIHVPVAFRDRLSRIITKSNGHIVSGDVVGNLCAQSWPKLLLSAPPAGFNLQTELSKRFALWRNGNLAELLVRIEEQCRLKKQTRSLKRSIKSQGAGRRARMLVQEGALSKAAKTLVGEVATLTGEEQAEWA